MPIPTATGAPTNKELLRKGMWVLWMVIINMGAVRLGRYLATRMYSTFLIRPLHLSDYTFTELVLGTELVHIVFLVVLLGIMTELSLNWRDETRHPINLHYEACMRAIFVTILILNLVRWIACHSAYQLFGWMLFFIVLLVVVAESAGWISCFSPGGR